jgi:hypothetical protein
MVLDCYKGEADMKSKRKSIPQNEAAHARDPFYEGIEESIRRYGWRLQGVLGDAENLPFIYTIGNHQIGLPELLVIGTEKAANCLNQVCEIMRTNDRPFEDGELIDVGGRFPMKSLNAGDEAKREYTIQVGEYYGTDDYAVQQIVIRDTSGRFPDDPRCQFPYFLAPLLIED